MKTATVRPVTGPIPTYPNAASHRYFLRKLLDSALAVAAIAGTITALIFLILL